MLSHDREPVGVRQGEGLIGELPHQRSRIGYRTRVEGLDAQWRQFFDKAQELNRAPLIVAPEKPLVSFCDDEG